MSLGNLFIRRDRLLGDIQLDAVINESYSMPVEVTQNPVELGANISDHKRVLPAIYTIEAVVTNTPIGLAGFTGVIGRITDEVSNLFGDSTGTGSTRLNLAFSSLEKLREDTETLTLQTGLREFENMVMVGLDINQDKTTSKALFFTAVFNEVIMPESEITEISKEQLLDIKTKSQFATSTNKGKQNLETGDEGILSSGAKKLAKIFGSK